MIFFYFLAQKNLLKFKKNPSFTKENPIIVSQMFFFTGLKSGYKQRENEM